MRINLYAEELTDEVVLVSKVVDAGTEHEREFYGVRLFLKSPPELHNDPGDDDRSAVTFWVPWTRADGHDFSLLESIFVQMHDKVQSAAFNEAMKRIQTAPAPATAVRGAHTTIEETSHV